MRARTIMIQGTATSVGKSLLTAALCRIFRQDGWRVAPFKAQNMNSYTYKTADGLEISHPQGIQAEAAGVSPTTDMNPVILKPVTDSTSEVLIHGRSRGILEYRTYSRDRYEEAASAIRTSLARLRESFDIVVLEGAGSPAEVNLRERELVNMRIAAWAEAPVLLVADIDRGGALAALVGTLELLEPAERDRVRGLIINKFRGDRSLLTPALEFLEQRTGRPVVGVVPYLSLPVGGEESPLLAGAESRAEREELYERLARVVREALDMERIYAIMGLQPR